MKIAFCVIAHTDYKQVENLVIRLKPNKYFDSKIFVHIDKKTDIAPYLCLNNYDYVKITDERVNVIRCGISQVDVSLLLLKCALECGEIFDRVVLITGQDYPTVSNKELAKEFSEDVEYVRVHKVTGGPQNIKVRRYYFYNEHLVGNKVKDTARKVLQTVFRIFKKNDTVSIYGEKKEIYYSSAYFAVSYSLAQELYCQGTNKKYYKYFKTSICSDEMYFATIAANSRFRNKLEVVENLSHTLLDNSAITYFEYRDRPIVLSAEQYDDIKGSNRMFARKFSSKDSVELMEKLNEERKESDG